MNAETMGQQCEWRPNYSANTDSIKKKHWDFQPFFFGFANFRCEEKFPSKTDAVWILPQHSRFIQECVPCLRCLRPHQLEGLQFLYNCVSAPTASTQGCILPGRHHPVVPGSNPGRGVSSSVDRFMVQGNGMQWGQLRKEGRTAKKKDRGNHSSWNISPPSLSNGLGPTHNTCVFDFFYQAINICLEWPQTALSCFLSVFFFRDSS